MKAYKYVDYSIGVKVAYIIHYNKWLTSSSDNVLSKKKKKTMGSNI